MPTAPRPAPAVAPAAYVADAANIDLFIIRACQIAGQRGQSVKVREVAARLSRSHEGTSQQLSFAGRRLDLLPIATLTPGRESELAQLLAASDFDAAFKRAMTEALTSARRLHSDYAQSGTSPTLRAVAKLASEAAERDLRLLTYL